MRPPCWLRAGMAAALLGLLLAAVGGCERPNGQTAHSAPAAVSFVDVTAASGIDFQHHRGAYGGKYMPETVGSGLAFLDYNNDGWLDLLYIDSTYWPTRREPGQHTRPALYRNDGHGAFTDVTKAAGLAFDQYGMGVAAGDFDNDGYTDLYLTAIGPNHLFRNRGDGTFEDVTARAGVAERDVQPGGLEWKWSSSASWVDYDRDGRLDLFVLNYVKWTIENDIWCGSVQKKSYCPPTAYEGLPATLYHNLGNGRFEDVTAAMGISQAIGKGFGIAVADYNGDGWPDLAVANDMEPDFLFFNEQGKRFREAGVEAGIAVADTGSPKAGMGIDVADWRNDGRFGLLVGNFAREGLSLYRNLDGERFEEVAADSGVRQPSLLFLTFGAFFFDYDNDGWQDLLAANGHIDDFISDNDSDLGYEQRPLIFHNRAGHFREVGQSLGPATLEKIVARGAAYGDYDNDGDLDVGFVWNGKKGLLWRNDGGNARRWLGILLQGVKSNRDGIGAVVRVSHGGDTEMQERKSGGSFLSENHPRLLFGLGDSATADVEVTWPSGQMDRYPGLTAGSYYRLTEGSAEPARDAVPTSGGVGK